MTDALQRLDLLVHRGRNADAAWLGKGLKPRGDVHSGAIDILALGNDLAEIDADAD